MKLPTFKPADLLAIHTRANLTRTIRSFPNHPLDPVLRAHLGLPPQPPKPPVKPAQEK